MTNYSIFLYTVYVIFGLGAYALFRRFQSLAWIFYLGVPLLLTFFWITGTANHDWFTWAKIYSALIFCYLVLLSRSLSEQKHKTHKTIFCAIYIITILNMLEAIWRSWALPLSVPALLNGFAGLVLILMLPKPKTMQIEANVYRDFTWDAPYTWIFGYTLWDLVFIYLVFAPITVLQICMLLPPLIVSFFNRKTYAQARVLTLSFFMIAGFSFPSLIEFQPLIQSTDQTIAWISAIAVLAYIIATSIWQFLQNTSLNT